LYGRDKKFHRIENQLEDNQMDSVEIIYNNARAVQLTSDRIRWLPSVSQRCRRLGSYCEALRKLINLIIPKIICNVLDAGVIWVQRTRTERKNARI
jgi:hypothetical protein